MTPMVVSARTGALTSIRDGGFTQQRQHQQREAERDEREGERLQ